MATAEVDRQFDLIRRRRYLLVAEWLGERGEGSRTARWMLDLKTGVWLVAESWTRPHKHRRLDGDQVAYVEGQLGVTTHELQFGHRPLWSVARPNEIGTATFGPFETYGAAVEFKGPEGAVYCYTCNRLSACCNAALL